MMSDKPRVVTAKLVKRGVEEEEFDQAFWREAGHQARLDAAFDMVKEFYLFRGEDAGELRLQRSVAVVKRRKE